MRCLRHAIAEARRRGAGRLTILADPNAAERAGAVRIGEAPSDALPGRLLPLYEVRLDSTGDRDLEPHLGGRSKRYEALCSSGKFRRASGSSVGEAHPSCGTPLVGRELFRISFT